MSEFAARIADFDRFAAFTRALNAFRDDALAVGLTASDLFCRYCRLPNNHYRPDTCRRFRIACNRLNQNVFGFFALRYRQPRVSMLGGARVFGGVRVSLKND